VFDTAETIYGAAPGVTPAEHPTVKYGLPGDVAAMVKAGQSATRASAWVDHSRWLVNCPDPTCVGCQYASKGDPRFFCNYCHNAAAGGWVSVDWPDDVEGIEAALAARPDPRTRNWKPGESVDDLLRENAENGAA